MRKKQREGHVTVEAKESMSSLLFNIDKGTPILKAVKIIRDGVI